MKSPSQISNVTPEQAKQWAKELYNYLKKQKEQDKILEDWQRKNTK